jgi:hypothetical protein
MQEPAHRHLRWLSQVSLGNRLLLGHLSLPEGPTDGYFC